MWRIKHIYTLIEVAQREGRLICGPSPAHPDLTVNFGFYPQGKLHFRITFQDGRLHGRGRIWHENGQLKEDLPLHKGTLHGPYRFFYSIGNYKSMRWLPENSFPTQQRRNDERSEEFSCTHGQMESEAYYVNGQYEGRRREWYPDGRLKSEFSYKMHLLEGPFSEWHPNGQIKEQGRYFEGLRHGLWKEFDSEGRLLHLNLYIRGTRLNGRIERLLNLGQLTPRHILKMRNTALRRICLEELGYARFLAGMDYERIDQDGEEELLRLDWHAEEEPIYLVKVRCPSTGAFYTLRVPPTMKKVRQAIAWTFGLTESEYHPVVES